MRGTVRSKKETKMDPDELYELNNGCGYDPEYDLEPEEVEEPIYRANPEHDFYNYDE